MNRAGLLKLAEDFDKARAFELGFAKAAVEHGLDEAEYNSVCKLAAQLLQGGADVTAADRAPAGDAHTKAYRAQVASLAGSAGKEATKHDGLIDKLKARVTGGGSAPPANVSKQAPFGTTPYKP